MFKKYSIVLLLSLTTIVGTSAAQAGIFKWVDANGLTHYSDKASKKHPTQTLDIGEANNTPDKEVNLKIAPKVQSETIPDLDAVEYDLNNALKKAS